MRKIFILAMLSLLFSGCSFLPLRDAEVHATFYKCFDGRIVGTLSECATSSKTCPNSCDDNDACTYDSCTEATNFTCIHKKQSPCCGDNICDFQEDCSKCAQDCACKTGEICSPNNIYSNEKGCLDSEKASVNASGMRTYNWNYLGKEWTLSIPIDNSSFPFYQSRSRLRPYDLFVSDPFDDSMINSIVAAFNQYAETKERGRAAAYLAVSFVQSLPYTSDLVTAGSDEYPRFPYETLLADGGDCEDTSILAAAILRGMGYDTVLIELPDHMAVGIKCGFTDKDRISYNGVDYCYLETTGEGWDVGAMPDEYKGASFDALQLFPRPYLYFNTSMLYLYNGAETKANVNVTLKNLGSLPSENTKVEVSLEDESLREWDSITYNLTRAISPEEETTVSIKNLRIPGTRVFRVKIQVRADNFSPQELTGEWVHWDNT